MKWRDEIIGIFNALLPLSFTVFLFLLTIFVTVSMKQKSLHKCGIDVTKLEILTSGDIYRCTASGGSR